MKPLIVKAARHHDKSIADRQFSIEQAGYEPGDFGEKYASFSGYFGDAGPHVFAAAPELLEALEHTQALLERIGMQSSDEYQANAAAIAKAKGETR